MSAPEDEELYFFIDLEDSAAMDLTIKTWGGEGDLGLSAETEEIEWDDFEERPMGRQFGETQFESDWSGADEEIYIFFARGRIDITIYANTEIEDISIVAKWDEIDEPGPGPGPEPGPEPPIGDDILSCDEYVKVIFEELDLNGDGDISSDESFDGDDNEFDEIDINKDGVIDKTEAIVAICTCENELYVTLEQINTDDRGEFSIEFLSSIAWKNEYDFFEMDSNNNMRVDYDEVEEYGENCVTTYDPLDRDGDGTPNDKDAFPDDPSEDKDTDGDGVGDNADIIASVDNDVIWVSASILGLVLATFLGIMFVRSRRGPEYAWEEYQKDRMSESMLAGMVNSGDMPPSQESVPPALDLGPPVENVPEDMTVSDLYD